MTTFDVQSTIGTLLIGLFFSCCLFGITAVQMYLYYTRFQDDRLMLKLMVMVIGLLELGHYVCICTESYNLAITNFGQPSALVSVSIFVDAALMTSVLITTAVQSYFVERLRNLSKRRIIPAICWTLTASRFVLLVTVTARGVLLHQLNAIEVLNRVKAFFTAGLVVGAIVDFSVAGCLAFHIRICKRDAHFPSLSHAMNRVAMWAIEIGLVTGLTELTLLILLLAMPENWAWQAMFICLARVFSNSLLASLNGRAKLRDSAEGNPIAQMIGGTAQNYSIQIQVSRTTQVAVDPAFEYGVF